LNSFFSIFFSVLEQKDGDSFSSGRRGIIYRAFVLDGENGKQGFAYIESTEGARSFGRKLGPTRSGC